MSINGAWPCFLHFYLGTGHVPRVEPTETRACVPTSAAAASRQPRNGGALVGEAVVSKADRRAIVQEWRINDAPSTTRGVQGLIRSFAPRRFLI